MEAVGRVAGVVGWHARAYRRLWFGSVTTSWPTTLALPAVGAARVVGGGGARTAGGGVG